MLRVGFVSNSSYNIAHYRLSWMKHLSRRDISVTAFSPPDGGESQLGQNYVPWNGTRRKISPTTAFKEIKELARLLRRERIDVVHTFTPKANLCGIIAARWAGVPVVVSHVTGLGTLFIDRQPSFKIRIIRRIFRAIISRSDFLVFQNSDDREVFEGNSSARTYLIPGSGVDPERFLPATTSERSACRNEFGFHTDEIVIVYTGRLLISKGIRELCEAVGQVAAMGYAVTALIAGDIDEGNPDSLSSSDVDELRRKPFQLLGFRNDVRALLAASDIVVFPSHREGMPFPVIEAMLMERPIITTDAPGCRETVVHNESGVIIETGNVSQFVEGLRYYIIHSDKAREMGKRAREQANKRFSLSAVLQSLDALYTDIENYCNEQQKHNSKTRSR